MNRTARFGLLSLVAIALASCGQGVDTESATHAGSWTDATAWHVASTPSVVIGTGNAEPAYQLARVRQAIRFGDRIQVINGAPPEIRVFDRAGDHLNTMGRSGDGPGEFRVIFGAWRIQGDSLVVYDPGTGRITVLDHEGGLVTTYQYESARQPDRSIPNVILGRFEDGSFMARPNVTRPTEADGDGLVRPEYALLRVAADASSIDTIITLKGSAYYLMGTDRGYPDWRSQPQTPLSFSVVRGSNVYVSDTEQFVVSKLSLDGAVMTRYERDLPVVPILDSDWEALMEGRVSDWLERFSESTNPEGINADNEVREIRRNFQQIPKPEAYRTHSRLVIDLEENVWVQHLGAPEATELVWSVFSAAGPFLGEVRTPTELRITEIGPDYILGVWTGEFDVQTVREFTLTKG